MKLRMLAALFYLLLSVVVGWPTGRAHADDSWQDSTPATVPIVVINEIHAKPFVKTERVEFVEFHNPTGEPISLSGWAIMGGIDFVFPASATIPPFGYLLVAENPAALQAKFGVTAFGPFSGRLDADGDRIVLRDGQARVVDEVSFGYGFPWPVIGETLDSTLQLINPSLDNRLAGNWRSAPATPGQRNQVYADNPPPRIDGVMHTPQTPRSWQTVVVTATVADADGLSTVTLYYQIVEPGAYIALHDRAYQTNWMTTPMHDAGNGVYQAELAPDLQRHRRIIRYRVEVVDNAGQRVKAPYPDDPQPNFAYFVYDGAPPWTASIDGSDANRLTYDFARMRPLPIYHIIAKKRDVADAMFMPDSSWREGYMGHDYLWRATLVYDGKVYDHITFRARGGLTRYATGKTMWKLNFNPAHSLQAYDDWGRPFQATWDKLNLSSVIQQTQRSRRGEQGLFESLSFRLFNLAGIEASFTYFIHFRVIDDAAEQGPSQYDGDFWGLYLAIEQPDGRFLDEHDLPDGNFYKVEEYQGEKNNQGATAAADSSDFDAFANRVFYSAPDPAWWRANVDLERYYRYRSIIEAIHHYDVDQGKNYFFYNHPLTNKWSVHPWDLDGTWYEKMPGSGVEPFLTPVLGDPQFNLEYQNWMRAMRDLLFNPEQMNAMVDEYANLIDSPANDLSMVDADRALWDQNPIYWTRYVNKDRTRPGHFYRFSPTRDFRGMAALMKQWVAERSAWIDAVILTDHDHPFTPAFSYAGAAGYPADQLRFTVGDFADPQGPSDFAALEWRIAEVTDPAAPGYNPTAPRIYEIDAVWESGELYAFQRDLTPPLGVMQPGHAYRARVRMKDRSGRWSHWSAPVSFVVALPAAAPPSALKVSEIMYNPLPEGYYDSDELEFVELQNVGQQALDLSNTQLGGGIDYRFPVGTQLGPGKFIVIARNRPAFLRRYGFNPFDEFDKKLDNSGDAVALSDAFGRAITVVEYDDDPPWPKETDGKGYSLALVSKDANPSRAEAWKRSAGVHGSPGAADPPPIFVNELLAAPPTDQHQAVELFNPNNEPVEIGGWFLTDSWAKPRKYRIPDGFMIPANGYAVLRQYEFIRPSFDGPMNLSETGGELYLVSASEERLTGYRHGFRYGASETGMTWGRHVNSMGREHLVWQAQPTIGAANVGPRGAPVAISAIVLESAVSGAAAIALTNTGDEAVSLFDPADPSRSWELHGGFFSFPAGVELASGESLLVTAESPHTYCLSGDVQPPGRVFGPFSRGLAETGQEITLWSARPSGAASTHLLADLVDFRIGEGFPYFGHVRGAVLRKDNPTSYGNDPANWRMLVSSPLPATVALDAPKLCSFVAEPTPKGEGVTLTWTMHTEEGVSQYILRRASTWNEAEATVVTPAGIVAQGDVGDQQVYTVLDAEADSSYPLYYWLEAVGVAGEKWQVGVTSPVRPFTHVYAPIIMHR